MSAAADLTTGADQRYFDALAEGHLELQRCSSCKTWHWPAVWRCSTCGSWEQVWEPVALEGAIFTWTRTWHPFGAPEALGMPYVSVLVALDGGNGARLSGVLEPQDQDVKIGTRVTGTPTMIEFLGKTIPAIRWRSAA